MLYRDLYAIARELGGIFRVTAPGRTIVVVSDPTILQEMVKDENVNFTKPKDLYKTFAEVGAACSGPLLIILTGNHRAMHSVISWPLSPPDLAFQDKVLACTVTLALRTVLACTPPLCAILMVSPIKQKRSRGSWEGGLQGRGFCDYHLWPAFCC